MFSRIRIYALIITVEALVFLAFWTWWSFSETVLFDLFRDMGMIESLQLILLSTIGLSFCLLSRYHRSSSNNPLLDFTFCQFIGACCFLLIFRELDYYFTYFMEESLFLLIWSLLITVTMIYGAFNLKRIFLGIREIISTRSFLYLIFGAVLYLVVAQIVGTKQFRNIFYPYSNNFSRRYIEESMEFIGALIIGWGMLELHLHVRGLLAVGSPEETNWKEDIWRSFTQAPQELSGQAPFKKIQGAGGGGQMTMEQQTLARRSGEAGPPATLVLPERVSRQLEELVFVAGKLRRSNTSFSATVLFIGISLVIALLWIGFVFRENAIENSTNFQMELLRKQYELQVEQYQTQPKKWKKSNSLPDFRYEQLRTAIRNDVAQEYNFANFFKREAHR